MEVLAPHQHGATASAAGLRRSVPTSNPGIGLDLALAVADRSLRRLGPVRAFAELGDISLPPVVGSPADADLFRLVAPLYLASEMEAAGLLTALDTTVRLFASGGITVDVGPVSKLLATMWRSRHRRFTVEERRAMFARLFGGGTGAILAGRDANADFEIALAEVAQALVAPSGRFGVTVPHTGLALAVRRLGQNVASHASGVPSLAARELLRSVKAALAVFGETTVQRWLGARSTWDAVAAADRRFGGDGSIDVVSHVRRARSGVVILGWVADVLPQIDGRRSGPDVVVEAAVEWIDATVSLWNGSERDG